MISATKWMYLKITILKKDDRHIKECNVYFHLFEYLGKLKLNISNKDKNNGCPITGVLPGK